MILQRDFELRSSLRELLDWPKILRSKLTIPVVFNTPSAQMPSSTSIVAVKVKVSSTVTF